jgi:sterol desaturase/sphingolipid hydroxylase (fatty acid hydroxylase superfamily)
MYPDYLSNLSPPTSDLKLEPPPTAEELRWWKRERWRLMRRRIVMNGLGAGVFGFVMRVGQNLGEYHSVFSPRHSVAGTIVAFLVIVLGIGVLFTVVQTHRWFHNAIFERRFFRDLEWRNQVARASVGGPQPPPPGVSIDTTSPG